MDKRELIYSGKVKNLYSTDDEAKLIMEFTDTLNVFHGTRMSKYKGKSAINTKISAYLFNYLENYHIPNHYLGTESDNEIIIRKLEVIPVKVVVRNFASGRFRERYNLEEGKQLDYPVIEHYLMDDSLQDPLVNDYHCFAFGLATPDEMRIINRIASKVNAIMRSFFDRRGLLLVDMKMEFGKIDNKILLADEISPDTLRLWDRKTGKKFGADRFRYDMGNVLDSYEAVKEIITG